jgi:prepilin-type N-terminal cleavage/methylation domain-containing protein
MHEVAVRDRRPALPEMEETLMHHACDWNGMNGESAKGLESEAAVRISDRRGHEAFTLIELLIVVAIIAILAAIAVPNFLEAQVRSKVARVYADLRTLRTGLEAYRVDHNRYPFDYGNEDRRTWSQLTTPVAYLTSIPNDSFYDPNLRADTNSDPTFQPFAYGFLDGQDGSDYFLHSAGPDLKWDNWDFPDFWDRWRSGKDATADMLYNPTNGSRSYGDIFATRIGVWNQ